MAWPDNGDTDWNTAMKATFETEHNNDGTHAIKRSVNGSNVETFTKYFTGTLDSDDTTEVAHGVSGGVAKILFVGGMAFNDNNNFWYANEVHKPAAGDADFIILVDDTNVRFGGVGTFVQGNGYRIKIDYIA